MKKLKIVALLLSLVVIVITFAGCSGNGKVLVVGTNAEFPPFEFINDGGEPDGFDMALIKEAAKLAEIEIKVENMEFKSLIAAVETGKINIIASGMTVTEERKKQLDFTDPYYTAVQKIVLRKGDEAIKGAEDLKGKKIGVQEGTTGDFIATDDIDAEEVFRYKKGVDAVMDLKNGRIDCVLIDKNPAEEYVKANSDSIYTIESGCEPENYAFAVKKGNNELLDKLNAALKELVSNGRYDELVKLYINN